MERRTFIGTFTAFAAATLSAQTFGALGGLDKIGGALGGDKGSSGAASWKDIAKSFGEAKASFAATAQQKAWSALQGATSYTPARI